MSITAASLLRRSRGAVRRYCHGFRRSFATRTPEIPKLLLSSPDNSESRYLYDLTGDDRKPLAFNREIHLPHIAGHHLVGSSGGYLFSVDPIGEIHATDPLTPAPLPVPSTAALPNMVGAVRDPVTGNLTQYVSSTHLLVGPPPGIDESIAFTDHYGTITSALASTVLDPCKVQFFSLDSMIGDYFRSVILSPSLDTVVLIHLGVHGRESRHLAFSRTGGSSWTALRSPRRGFHDAIFHKGRLHAVDYRGTLYVFDDLDNPSASGGPPPSRSSSNKPVKSYHRSLRRSLVESPDGEDLFLVLRVIGGTNYFDDGDSDDCPRRTKCFYVYKLDKASHEWNGVHDTGDLALFLGFNHSTSLSASDYPGSMIKPNCIYFTDVYREWYMRRPHWVGDTGVYSLIDRSIRFYELTDGSQQLHWPPPVWFMPPTR